MGETVRPPRLDSLTGLRFAAALGVLLDHAQSFGVNGYIVNPLGDAVSFFFVLSGFVLTWAWRPGTLAFYRRRIARIFPVYAVAVLAAIGVGAICHVDQSALTTLRLLTMTETWTPHGSPGVDAPVWTLSIEVFFYLTFPVWIVLLQQLSKTERRVLAVVLAAGFTVAWAATYHDVTPFTYWFFYGEPLMHLPEFLLGSIAALEVRDGLRVSLLIAAPALGLACWPVWSSNAAGAMPNGLLLVPFALLIAAFASADLRGWRTFFNSRPMVRLGIWSYSLYLFHFLVYYLIEQTTAYWPLWMKQNQWEVATFVIIPPIIVAALVYHFIEAPMEQLIRTGVVKRRTAAFAVS